MLVNKHVGAWKGIVTSLRSSLLSKERCSELTVSLSHPQNAFSKLFANTEAFADILDADMPELIKDDPKRKNQVSFFNSSSGREHCLLFSGHNDACSHVNSSSLGIRH